MGKAAWQSTVNGVTKSQTRLKRLSTHITGGGGEGASLVVQR